MHFFSGDISATYSFLVDYCSYHLKKMEGLDQRWTVSGKNLIGEIPPSVKTETNRFSWKWCSRRLKTILPTVKYFSPLILQINLMKAIIDFVLRFQSQYKYNISTCADREIRLGSSLMKATFIPERFLKNHTPPGYHI
jgi:hypothetical protein